MPKPVKDIERAILELSAEERAELMRSLITDLDAPADANVDRAWLETSQRRYRELVESKVRGVPGPLAFDRLRKRLGGTSFIPKRSRNYMKPLRGTNRKYRSLVSASPMK